MWPTSRTLRRPRMFCLLTTPPLPWIDHSRVLLVSGEIAHATHAEDRALHGSFEQSLGSLSVMENWQWLHSTMKLTIVHWLGLGSSERAFFQNFLVNWPPCVIDYDYLRARALALAPNQVSQVVRRLEWSVSELLITCSTDSTFCSASLPFIDFPRLVLREQKFILQRNRIWENQCSLPLIESNIEKDWDIRTIEGRVQSKHWMHALIEWSPESECFHISLFAMVEREPRQWMFNALFAHFSQVTFVTVVHNCHLYFSICVQDNITQNIEFRITPPTTRMFLAPLFITRERK